MKNFWIGLLAVGSVFAIDEYKSIDKGAIELDLGIAYGVPTTNFDADGKGTTIEGDNSFAAFGFQGKYGITDELDVELALAYQMATVDMGELGTLDLSGLGQPELGFKYTMPSNIGAYANFILPFGSEDIVGPSPVMSFDIGGLHWLEADQFVMATMLGLTYSLEDEDKNQEGLNIDLLVKPGFLVNEQMELNLGVAFNYAMENKSDGNGLDDAGHLLTLRPGVQYMIDEKMAIEAIGTYDVIGKNTEGFWTANLFFYYTI